MSSAKVQVVSQRDYLPARMRLLEQEKALMKLKDDVTQQRQNLPIVEVTKPYTFTALDDSGRKTQCSLSDLFHQRSQLIVYHAMFDPCWDAACASCSLLMASMSELRHLNSRDVTLVAVSRAPIEKIQEYKERLGFVHPWISSEGSDFNYDFCVTVDESKGQDMYNFRSKAENEKRLLPWFTKGEQSGHSVFIKGNSSAGVGEDGKIYHTYSAYARGGENIVPTFAWLDMTLLGRQDGINDEPGTGFKRTDEYTEENLKGIWKRSQRATASVQA